MRSRPPGQPCHLPEVIGVRTSCQAEQVMAVPDAISIRFEGGDALSDHRLPFRITGHRVNGPLDLEGEHPYLHKPAILPWLRVVGCHNARTTLLGWVSRDRQAALRYSLISPLTVVRRLIGAVMSLASPGLCTV